MSPAQNPYDFSHQLIASKEFFERSSRVLDEADSGFRPHEGMMTVAQQVAHTVIVVDDQQLARSGSVCVHPMMIAGAGPYRA